MRLVPKNANTIPLRPAPCSVETTMSGALFHWDSSNRINSSTAALPSPVLSP